ncbi:MAG: hypothetical protein Q8N65_02260 [bacterium]|nr:hypothetical protein [bacterium]
MLLSFLFLLAQLVFGFLVFDFFDPQKRFSPFERVLASILLGGLFSGFLVLALALWWQSLFSAVLVFISLSFLMVVFRFFKRPFLLRINLSNLRRHFSRQNAWIVFLLALMVFYWLLLSTVLFRAGDGTLRGALVGWGDIALHLNMIERMATAQPFVIDHPVAAGVHLVYPFLINFISAIFRSFGLDIVLAFQIPLFIFGSLSLLLVFALADRVLASSKARKKVLAEGEVLKSKNLAILVLILVILGSGLGFKVFFEDLQKDYQKNGFIGLSTILVDPPHEYTHLDNRTGGKPAEKDTNDNIVWIVPVISFLSHQRSFPLGLAIFSFLLLSLLLYGQDRQFWRFGLVAGLLPLSHAPSFLTFFFLMASLSLGGTRDFQFLFFTKNWKAWFKFGLLTALLALPQIIYLKAGSQVLSSGFIRPWFGWMTTDSNPFVFWSKNFGLIFWGWSLILVLAMILFLVPRFRDKIKERLSIGFLLASLVLFILPNLFLFQPWPFDNNKILFYWWLLAIIFGIGPLLSFLWQQRVWGKLALISFVFLAVLAGSLDFAARLGRPRNSNSHYYGYSDSNKDKVASAAWIRDNTKPNDLFLTSRDVDPLPVFLAGRPVYLGFEGWLWTEGLDYSRNRMVAESVVAGDLKKACDEKIAYILLDDDLRRDYPRVDEEKLLEKTQVVFASGSRQILKLICP